MTGEHGVESSHGKETISHDQFPFANDKKFLGAINRKPTGMKAARSRTQFSIDLLCLVSCTGFKMMSMVRGSGDNAFGLNKECVHKAESSGRRCRSGAVWRSEYCLQPEQ